MTAAKRFALASSTKATLSQNPLATSPEERAYSQMLACLSGLAIEAHGVRIDPTGPSCLERARREYGIAADDAAAAHAELRAKMVAHRIIDP